MEIKQAHLDGNMYNSNTTMKRYSQTECMNAASVLQVEIIFIALYELCTHKVVIM